ncbi:MAG: hypothetical protein OEM02_05715 [Desulfobulbaceae bacterium]|nr:hypothetical protein [Desulfobulbaceae bacterium]
MQNAALRLFNAIAVDQKCTRKISKDVLKRTIKHGYILDKHVQPNSKLLESIEKIVGISGEKANSAFHKSWLKIQESSMEALVIQQLIHYFTTYGFEELGIYNESTVYIPHEKLELPEINTNISLTVIRALTPEEILFKIIGLGSGIALAQETLDDIMVIIKGNKYDNTFVEQIANRELKALLYDYYGIVPSAPIEFLRYLISKLTDESLLIKNNYLIEKITDSDGRTLDILLEDAPDNLASIFFRFKPLFLAMKKISSNKTFFNRLRKKANKLHAPLPEDYLNNVTSKIKHNKLDPDLFAEKIQKASTLRKIRLANALNYRLNAEKSIIYRVRNGRGWATDFNWRSNLHKKTRQALDIILTSIAEDIEKNVAGEIFYIPPNVHYALPTTEKQFTGHVPTGSFVSVPEDLIVGIHWTNTKKRRVDLDLSLIGVTSKIGWDASYRSKEHDILFSGDVTDAPQPHGASELFYISKGLSEAKILMANYYNFSADNPVDCKIITAHENPQKFGQNYMIDINNMVLAASIKISRRQNILGLIINLNGENRVYFANVSIGNSITSSKNANSIHARNYLIGSTVNNISLKKILTMAGATVVHKMPDGEFINLAPEQLNKKTLINLINPL